MMWLQKNNKNWKVYRIINEKKNINIFNLFIVFIFIYK